MSCEMNQKPTKLM